MKTTIAAAAEIKAGIGTILEDARLDFSVIGDNATRKKLANLADEAAEWLLQIPGHLDEWSRGARTGIPSLIREALRRVDMCIGQIHAILSGNAEVSSDEEEAASEEGETEPAEEDAASEEGEPEPTEEEAASEEAEPDPIKECLDREALRQAEMASRIARECLLSFSYHLTGMGAITAERYADVAEAERHEMETSLANKLNAALEEIKSLRECADSMPDEETELPLSTDEGAERAIEEARSVGATRLKQWLDGMKPRVDKVCSEITKEYLEEIIRDQFRPEDWEYTPNYWDRRYFRRRLVHAIKEAEKRLAYAEAWLAEGEQGNPRGFCQDSAAALFYTRELEKALLLIS